MPGDQGDLVYLVQPRRVDREDVEQEAQIWEFTHPGKRARRSLVRKALESREPAATFQGDPTRIGRPLWDNTPEIPNPAAIARIREWAQGKSVLLQQAIEDYLREDTDEKLETIKKLLIREGVKQDRNHTAPRMVTFHSGLMRILSDGKPHNMTELYAWARSFHQARRPEATLRQALRRLKTKGLVDDHKKGIIQLKAGISLTIEDEGEEEDVE